MSATISVQEAQTRLKELVAKLAPGEEVILTDNERPVAKIVSQRAVRSRRPACGLGKGSVLHLAPDFDDTPEEFKEYTE